MNISQIINRSGFAILCEAGSSEQIAESMGLTLIVCLAGLIVFGIWLLTTSWGTRALVDSTPRRNSMPPYAPFIALFVWFVLVPVMVSIGRILTPDFEEWQTAALDNAVYCVGGLVLAGGAVVLARGYFEGRLKGLGLDVRTIHKDLVGAGVNLLCIWPLVLAAIMLTTKFGKAIWGPDFEMQPHEQLKLMGEYSQWSLRILIVAVAAVVAPVIEEVLFRGLFQTMIRSVLSDSLGRRSAWPAIGASSALFAMAHGNAAHWPALFVLGVCMGYSYEKSGSLFRPIFIHAMFNGINLLGVLMG